MNSDDENMKPVNAILILEVVGKPAEHLTETLEGLVKKIAEEKGVEIIEKKINEPVAMEKHAGFFTSFAEIEVRTEDLRILAALMFKYMPAHIDVLEPENLVLTNNVASELLNELTRRLHGYDEIAKVVQVEKRILENKLKALLADKKGEVKKESSENSESKK